MNNQTFFIKLTENQYLMDSEYLLSSSGIYSDLWPFYSMNNKNQFWNIILRSYISLMVTMKQYHSHPSHKCWLFLNLSASLGTNGKSRGIQQGFYSSEIKRHALFFLSPVKPRTFFFSSFLIFLFPVHSTEIIWPFFKAEIH